MLAHLSIACAALQVGVTGLGFNLLAVPLLALMMPSKEAVIVTLLVGTVMSTALAFVSKQQMEVGMLRLLLAGSLPGMLVGAVAFRAANDRIIQLAIGLSAIVIVGVTCLNTRRLASSEGLLTGRVSGLGVGFVSGWLIVTTGMSGPPILMYLMLLNLSAETTRATMLGYVSSAGILAVTLLALHGGVDGPHVERSVHLLPAAFVGLASGHILFNFWPQLYRPAIRVTLLIVAATGLAVAVNGH